MFTGWYESDATAPAEFMSLWMAYGPLSWTR